MSEGLFLGFTKYEISNISTKLDYLFRWNFASDFPTDAVGSTLIYLGCTDSHRYAERWGNMNSSLSTVEFTKEFLEDLYVHLNACWWRGLPCQASDHLLAVLNWLEDKAEIPGDSPLHEARYFENKKEKEEKAVLMAEWYTENQEVEALRHNTGKTPFAYLPMHCLEGAARVMKKGSEKYSKGNYLKGYDDLASPLSSLMRHVAALQESFEKDDKSLGFDAESQEHHADHVITSAILLIQTLKLKGLYTK